MEANLSETFTHKMAFVGVAALLSVASQPTTIEIAPGVQMPLLNMGFHSNHTEFISLGGRGLDTALVYGDPAQKEVGAAVRASGLSRSELFVTTKIPCCPDDFASAACLLFPLRNVDHWIDHDFETLGLDYVDLMLLHWPCHRPEDTLATYRHMERLVAAGKARAIGISNFNATAIDWLLSQQLSVRPVVNQCGHSIGGHAPTLTKWGRDDPTVAKCREENITYSAYSPLGGWTKVPLDRALGPRRDPRPDRRPDPESPRPATARHGPPRPATATPLRRSTSSATPRCSRSPKRTASTRRRWRCAGRCSRAWWPSRRATSRRTSRVISPSSASSSARTRWRR